MRFVLAYGIGLLFGLGIIISGMANPAKVVNFFDLAGLPDGMWDPSLAFVMGGALVATLIGYRFVLPRSAGGRREAPLLDERFHMPPPGRIDARLVGGSALFGLGWGIAGFCPGGALPVLGTGVPAVLIFCAALVGGILLARLFLRLRPGGGTGTVTNPAA